MINNHRELFNQWLVKTDKLSSLSAYIQNDFEKLLLDNYITPIEIQNSINQLESEFARSVRELNKLKKEVINYMEQFTTLK